MNCVISLVVFDYLGIRPNSSTIFYRLIFPNNNAKITERSVSAVLEHTDKDKDTEETTIKMDRNKINNWTEKAGLASTSETERRAFPGHVSHTIGLHASRPRVEDETIHFFHSGDFRSTIHGRMAGAEKLLTDRTPRDLNACTTSLRLFTFCSNHLCVEICKGKWNGFSVGRGLRWYLQ